MAATVFVVSSPILQQENGKFLALYSKEKLYLCARSSSGFVLLSTTPLLSHEGSEKDIALSFSVIAPPFNMPNYYTPLSSFLSRYFEHKVQKITLNAGFTCPNRDGTRGRGGCTYCNNQSFNPDYQLKDESITAQLERGKAFFRRAQQKRAEKRGKTLNNDDWPLKYLAYFQAYTNTYGELEHLRRLYEEALSVDDVVGLVVGTRPDCMPDTLLDYFEQLARDHFVHIEYGVESCNDALLQRINRGHDFACSVDAIERTAARGLPVGAHLILGLPGETREATLAQAQAINALPIDTLKLHQLQIVRGTAMCVEYQRALRAGTSDFLLYTPEEYVALVVDFLERLRPDIVVERFTSSSPRELLIAPDWGLKNYEFVSLVNREFARRDSRQGTLFG